MSIKRSEFYGSVPAAVPVLSAFGRFGINNFTGAARLRQALKQAGKMAAPRYIRYNQNIKEPDNNEYIRQLAAPLYEPFRDSPPAEQAERSERGHISSGAIDGGTHCFAPTLPPEMPAQEAMVESTITTTAEPATVCSAVAEDSVAEGFMEFQKWWYLRDVDISVNGMLLRGVPSIIRGGVLRVIGNEKSYFIQMKKIDFFSTPDGFNCIKTEC